MPTLFDAPSPSGRNDAKLYLDSKGRLLDRRGNFWGRSGIARLAMDAALAPPDLGTGEKKTPMDWAKSNAMATFRGDVQKFCNARGMSMEEHQAFLDAINDHLSGESEADRGKGALDDGAGPGLEALAEFLAGKGLSRTEVAEALAIFERDHEAEEPAEDRLPLNGLYGTDGHTSRGPSGSRSEYEPSDSVTEADIYGEPNSQRLMRDFDPVRAWGERLGAELPSGGVSRRLGGDMAFDEELTRLIDAVKVGPFG